MLDLLSITRCYCLFHREQQGGCLYRLGSAFLDQRIDRGLYIHSQHHGTSCGTAFMHCSSHGVRTQRVQICISKLIFTPSSHRFSTEKITRVLWEILQIPRQYHLSSMYEGSCCHSFFHCNNFSRHEWQYPGCSPARCVPTVEFPISAAVPICKVFEIRYSTVIKSSM